MTAVVWVAFAVAGLAVFVSTRVYRYASIDPGMQARTPELKKSGMKMVLWVAALLPALIVEMWVAANVDEIPLPGRTLVFVAIAGFITVGSILAGLVLGVKHGREKQRLRRS